MESLFSICASFVINKSDTLQLEERHSKAVVAFLKEAGKKKKLEDKLLEVLKPLKSLKSLDLNESQVTEKCLEVLLSFPNLQSLRISNNQSFKLSKKSQMTVLSEFRFLFLLEFVYSSALEQNQLKCLTSLQRRLTMSRWRSL